MKPRTKSQAFESSIPFQSRRIHAVAVYCSDGRFGEHVDEFLQVGLGLPHYDRLAVPGGAACLAGHSKTHREEKATIEQLRFLIAVHEIQRVVLVAHQGCAFYLERLQVPPPQVEPMQREDAAKAVERVRELGFNGDVDAYFLSLDGESIRFVAIDA